MKMRNVIVTVELKTALTVAEIKMLLAGCFKDVKQVQVNVVKDKK